MNKYLHSCDRGNTEINQTALKSIHTCRCGRQAIIRFKLRTPLNTDMDLLRLSDILNFYIHGEKGCRIRSTHSLTAPSHILPAQLPFKISSLLPLVSSPVVNNNTDLWIVPFDLAGVRNGILCVWFETALIIISDNRSENAADTMRRLLLLNNCLEFMHSFHIWLELKEGIHKCYEYRQTVSCQSFQL